MHRTALPHITASITFVISIGRGALNELFPAILGLALGGAVAAPLAAFLTKRINPRALMFLVGFLIAMLSLRTILIAVGVL